MAIPAAVPTARPAWLPLTAERALLAPLPQALLSSPRVKTVARVPLATRAMLRRAALARGVYLNDLYLSGLYSFGQRAKVGSPGSWLRPKAVRSSTQGWAQAALVLPKSLHDAFVEIAARHTHSDGTALSVASVYLTALVDLASVVNPVPKAE